MNKKTSGLPPSIYSKSKNSTNGSAKSYEQLRQEIGEFVRSNPRAMTLMLAQQFAVPEVEILRAYPQEWVSELQVEHWEAILRKLEVLEHVHVIVSNSAATIEVQGRLTGFSTWGEFFNVQNDALDMHLRPNQFGALFAVMKPSHVNGQATHSVQVYDREGDSVMKIFLSFGESKPAHETVELFEYIGKAFGVSPSG